MRYFMIGATLLATLAVGLHYMHTEKTPANAPRPAVESDNETTAEPPEKRAAEESRSAIAARYDLTEKELRRKTREQAYQQAAEARFKQAVKMDGLSPDAVAPDVRALFGSMKLEPVIDTDNTYKGSVDGMRIERLGEHNPLADAGFTRGDRLTRINGMALNDPAEIAHLFTRIDKRMEICVEEAGKETCKQVTL